MSTQSTVLDVRPKNLSKEYYVSLKEGKPTKTLLKYIRRLVEYHIESRPHMGKIDYTQIIDEVYDYTVDHWLECKTNQDGRVIFNYFRIMIEKALSESLNLRSNTAKKNASYQILMNINSEKMKKGKKEELLKKIRTDSFDNDKFIEEVSAIVAKYL